MSMDWRTTPYTRSFTAGGMECDYAGQLYPAALQSKLLDCAIAHAELMGCSRQATYGAIGGYWMLIRLGVIVDTPPVYGQQYTVTTWPRGVSGPYFMRDYTVDCGGVTIAKASSAWLITNIEARKIIRARDYPYGVVSMLPDLPEQVPLTKLSPAGELVYLGCHTVVYSDIDINNHVNNTRYVAMICDALALHTQNRRLRTYQINYNKQCLHGECIELHSCTADDGALYVLGSVEGEARVEMRCLLA